MLLGILVDYTLLILETYPRLPRMLRYLANTKRHAQNERVFCSNQVILFFRKAKTKCSFLYN